MRGGREQVSISARARTRAHNHKHKHGHRVWANRHGAFDPTSSPDDPSEDGRLRGRRLRSCDGFLCSTSLASESEPCLQSAQCVPRRYLNSAVNSIECLSIRQILGHQFPDASDAHIHRQATKKLNAFC